MGGFLDSNVFLKTERLLLRWMLPTDAEQLFELDVDPEVRRYTISSTEVTSSV